MGIDREEGQQVEYRYSIYSKHNHQEIVGHGCNTKRDMYEWCKQHHDNYYVGRVLAEA